MSRLLVVDDEPSICWALSRLGQSLGHEVVTASSAEQALELVARQPPETPVGVAVPERALIILAAERARPAVRRAQFFPAGSRRRGQRLAQKQSPAAQENDAIRRGRHQGQLRLGRAGVVALEHKDPMT